MRVFCSAPAAPTELYTLSLHDALPIFGSSALRGASFLTARGAGPVLSSVGGPGIAESADDILAPNDRPRIPLLKPPWIDRSEEHTSELQSHVNLVCRLLPEKKNKYQNT